MKAKTVSTLLFAVVACSLPAHVRAEEKTASEKTSEAWDATKKTTKEVTQKVVTKTKEVVSAAEAAVSKPDADAKKVAVKVTDKRRPASRQSARRQNGVRRQEHRQAESQL